MPEFPPMRLAMDGGAFQQGIAAGILNVAVGIINEMATQCANFELVLVVDPRLGPAREDLVSRLSVRPTIVEAAVGPAYSSAQKHLGTRDPDIAFEVDGIRHDAALVDGTATYRGPHPQRSFRILSRSCRPSDLGSTDDRLLGVAIARIGIGAGEDATYVSIYDPRLHAGFHQAEAGLRWTDGRADIPVSCFGEGGSDEDVDIEVEVVSNLTYSVLGGRLDPAFARIGRRLEKAAIALELRKLEERLLGMGVQGFLVNHFLPIRFERLKTYALGYDLIPILFPKFFMGDARANFAHNVDVFKAAEHVFTISEATRNDVMRELGVAPDRVTAVMIDIDPSFSRRPPEEIATVAARYGLSSRPYLLCVGTLEPRKNHRRLIHAFAQLLRQRGDDLDLALVGKDGWGTDGLRALVRELALTDRVRFLPDVPNDDLSALYSGALGAAYPSLYEGFGLPVLEAMACGCPVVTSNVSSMPEIAGDAALLVDPESVESIRQALSDLAADPGLRKELARKGSLRRPSFAWKASARRALEVLVEGRSA